MGWSAKWETKAVVEFNQPISKFHSIEYNFPAQVPQQTNHHHHTPHETLHLQNIINMPYNQ